MNESGKKNNEKHCYEQTKGPQYKHAHNTDHRTPCTHSEKKNNNNKQIELNSIATK